MDHSAHISSINTLECTTSLGSTISAIDVSSQGKIPGKGNTATFNTIDLQRLSVSSNDHPVEQADWVHVNEQLRRRGLHPILLTHSTNNTASNEENEKRQAVIEKLNRPRSRKNTASSPIKQILSKENQDGSLKSKWDFNIPTFNKDTGTDKDFMITFDEKYEKKIENLQKEIDDLRNSLRNLRGDHKQTNGVVASTSIIPSALSQHETPKSQKETGRSRESHDTNQSLAHCFQSEESIAMKYKKKCAALKSKIHILKIENSQLQVRIQFMETVSHGRRSDKVCKTQKQNKERISTANLLQRSDKHGCYGDCKHIDNLNKLFAIVGEQSHDDCIQKIQTWKHENEYLKELEKLLEKLNELVHDERSDAITILDSRMDLFTSLLSWKADRDEIDALYTSVKTLSLLLMPRKNLEEFKNNGKVTVNDINKLLQEINVAVYRGPNEKEDVDLTEEQMRNTVHHFMRLFNVGSSTAVYTRMHDIYVKYFEMVNVFNCLRDMLHLRKECTLNYLINAVSTLSKAKHLLHVQKLDSVIKQVEHYDRFYAAFYGMTKELMELLEVDNLEEVIPVVKTLIKNE